MNSSFRRTGLLLLLIASSIFFSSCNSSDTKTSSPKIPIRIVVEESTAPFLSSFLRTAKDSIPFEFSVRVLVRNPIEAAETIALGELKSELWLAPSPDFVSWVNEKIENLGAPQKNCTPLFQNRFGFVFRRDTAKKLGFLHSQFPSEDFFDVKNELPGKMLRTGYETWNPARGDGRALFSTSALLPAFGIEKAVDHSAAELSQPIRSLRAYSFGVNDTLLGIANSPPFEARTAIASDRMLESFRRDNPKAAASLALYFPSDRVQGQQILLCSSEADRISAKQKQGVDLVRTLLTTIEAKQLAKEFGFQIPSDTPLQNLPTLSTVPALSLEQFNQVREIWEEEAPPLRALIAFDHSASTGENAVLVGVKTALRDLLSHKNPSDTIALLPFSTEAPRNISFQQDEEELRETLKGLNPSGGSAVRDALKRGLDIHRQETSKSSERRLLVVITDSSDTSSLISASELKNIIANQTDGRMISVAFFALTENKADFSGIKPLIESASGIFHRTSTGELYGDLRRLFGYYN